MKLQKETEIISAIFTPQPSESEVQSELSIRKDEIDRKLQKFINTADREDYAIAVASGVICGIIDSLFVGEFISASQSIGVSHKQINEFIQKTAKKSGYTGQRLNGAIEHLEKTFSVAQDNTWKGAGIGVSSKEHHLADFAHHPTPLGLVSSIIVQFLRVGIFFNNNGEIHILPVKTDPSEIIKTWIPVVITGICNWLVSLAKSGIEESEGAEIPKQIKSIIHLIASSPLLIEILRVTQNWLGHLVSDMGGSKNTAGGGMGIPGVFLSLAYEISSLPVFKNSGLPNVINSLYVKHKMDFRHELPLLKIMNKQALVVIINETIVRTFYFVRRLVNQIKDNNGLENLDWERIIPFDNKTILRMTTISSVTFTVTDLIDAGVRGAVESAGNWAVFACKFVNRVNYVGMGRIAISVVAEAKSQKEELALIHEKRVITEQISNEKIAEIMSFRNTINSMIEEFFAEDLEAFLTGFEKMIHGIKNSNSDIFIGGNVIIQRKLGKEVQFKDQSGFDALMSSDEPLKL